MIDATPQELEIVNGILSVYVSACEVRAFGSRAKWEAKDHSDLDLVVKGESELDRGIIADLKDAFAESDLRFRVDVVDWHAVSDAFRDAIGDESVRIRNSANEEWQETTLGECADVFNETVSPTELGDTPYIGLEHIGENSLALLGWGSAEDVTSIKSRFRKGDVLFGKLRPYFRKVIRAPFDGIGSTDIWVIRPKNGIDAGYLYYLMATQQVVDFATQGSIGTKMPRAKWDHVSRYPVNLPPLPEQRRIAHILGTLDDKIELNRRLNETLEEMARAVFKDWFVDFGPVRAKIEGREAYLPEEIWRLFPDRLVESELGEVPEGWGVRRLGEFFPVLTGKKDANYATDDGNYPFFTYAADQTLFASGFSFDTDAILLAGNGNFNVKWYRGRFEAYQRTYVLTPYNRECLGILFQLMSYRLTDLTLGQKGTVVNYLTKGMITDYEVVLPDDAMLVCLSNIFSKLMACQEVLKRSTTNLSSVRDTLLPVLISGEVKA